MKNILKSSFFIIILLAPLAGWLSGVNIKFDENRKKSNMPSFSIKKLIERQFYFDYEKFFNDNFVFRGTLIKTKNWIDFYLLNTSPTKNVFIGKDGWLYYKNEIKDYVKSSCGYESKNKMIELSKQLQKVEKIIESSGRKFVFIIAPNKSTIYPEHVGLSLTGCKSDYDLFLDSLKNRPLKNFVRLDEILMSGKSENQLYYKTDSHWNINGATIAGTAILRHIDPVNWQKYIPRVAISSKLEQRDLALLMSISMFENTVYAKEFIYKSEVKSKTLIPLVNGKPRLSMTSSSRYLLPKTILFRDSFMTLPIEFIKGSFTQLDAFSTHKLSTPELLEELKDSEIIIFEIVERNLHELNFDLKFIEMFFSIYKLDKNKLHI